MTRNSTASKINAAPALTPAQMTLQQSGRTVYGCCIVPNLPQLEALADRWADESEYEDINEYRKVAAKIMADQKIEKMFTKPFGFDFTMRQHPGILFTIKIGAKISYTAQALKGR